MNCRPPKLTVSIYLRGNRLEPDCITAMLGIEPSEFQKKGELRPGSKVIAQIGVWSLTAQSNSLVAEELIDELLSKVKAPQMPLDEIAGVEEAYLDIFIALDYEIGTEERVELTLSKTHIEELNWFGLRVQFTVT